MTQFSHFSALADAITGEILVIPLLRAEQTYMAALCHLPADAYELFSRCVTEMLHENEQKVLAQFKIERRRASYLMGRVAAKLAVAYHLRDTSLREIEISNGIFGQPFVRCAALQRPSVSISHSGAMICALAFPEEHPMGLDVEHCEANKVEILESQMTPAERLKCQSHSISLETGLTILWTAKEALSKVLRCGITCPFEMFEVTDLEIGPEGAVGNFKNFEQYKFTTWLIDGYALSIALPRKTTIDIPSSAANDYLRRSSAYDKVAIRVQRG